MKCSYLGHEALTFPDYIDLDTGRTLHAMPGRVYDITPASGRNVEDIPGQWFTAVQPAPVKGKVVSAAAGLGGTGDLTGEPATGEPQPE